MTDYIQKIKENIPDKLSEENAINLISLNHLLNDVNQKLSRINALLPISKLSINLEIKNKNDEIRDNKKG